MGPVLHHDASVSGHWVESVGAGCASLLSRARNPRWEPGMGMIPDPRSPANRGWEVVYSKSILRTVPWVLASTQRPVLEALCLQPLSGRHGMSPNAPARYGSAVELPAWLPILVGHCYRHTARVVTRSSLGYHPADSKRAQRAICNEENSDAIPRIGVKE